MKLVVLAAGYATRLYPLTRDRPKALLPIAGRPILEHLLDRLAPIEHIERTYVVTNSRFADGFDRWAKDYRAPRAALRPIVVDDGTSSDETKRGAIGDLALVIETQGIGDDLVVVAGDQVFSDELAGFGEAARERKAPLLAVYEVEHPEDLAAYSEVGVDEDGRVVSFVEKPKRPSGTLTGVALCYYPRSTLPLVGQYLAEGGDPDPSGRLLEWLHRRTTVHAWPVPGLWLDVGSPETLRKADRLLAGPSFPR